MNRLVESFGDFSLASVQDWERILSALLVFLIGFVALRMLTRMLMRAIGKGLRDQSRELIRKAIVYTGTAVLFVMVLNAAGVSVGALLGAAGVLGIAIGIASQASLSNIISGLFLVSERFFEIGDVVRFAEHVGIVQSIDLLSIKIKTFDNVLIRVPNQQLIEKDFVNITRYPIRRMDFVVTVAPTERLDKIINALLDATSSAVYVLQEPEPFIMADGFGEDGLAVRLGIWFERPNYVEVRNAIVAGMQRVFTERGIAIRGRTVQIHDSDPSTPERTTFIKG